MLAGSLTVTPLCKLIPGETGAMGDESTKRAAEEYLAARLAEEGQSHEDKLNLEAAVALAPRVWKSVAETVIAKCNEWNAVTKEQTLTCKETALGDLRVWCAGKSQVMTVHYDSKMRLITLKNTARPEHEKDLILSIEGCSTSAGRDARLMRNNQPANLDVLIVGELRVLVGLSRQTKG
jgi:hypothetical protein